MIGATGDQDTSGIRAAARLLTRRVASRHVQRTKPTAYDQLSGVANEDFRNRWVESWLNKINPDKHGLTLLDIGAGLAPYRQMAIRAGYAYQSHDFSKYKPSSDARGLQNTSWEYPKHDYICDILDIPPKAKARVVLCTEVLEHVPDPVRALAHISELVEPSGLLIITVPFLSLMHQAPYWFQAGLSPFWFQYWIPRNSLSILELTVNGDYVDLMTQEVERLLTVKGVRVARIGAIVRRLRPLLSTPTLESGGFGTLCVAQRMGA